MEQKTKSGFSLYVNSNENIQNALFLREKKKKYRMEQRKLAAGKAPKEEKPKKEKKEKAEATEKAAPAKKDKKAKDKKKKKAKKEED